MTALSITAANVKYINGPILADQVAGEAFIAGAEVYQLADGTWKKAQCDGTALEAGSKNLGMALFTADAAGARGSIGLRDAVVQVAASGLAVGVPYCVGRTAGSLVPVADLLSTDKVTIAALSISATQLQLCRDYNDGAVLA